MIKFIWPVAVLTGLTLASAWLLWFMVRRPARWGVFVDRENEFWSKRGIISAGLAERVKSWEKGWPMKLITGAVVGLGLLGMVLTAVWLSRARAAEDHGRMMPYNPALHVKPMPKAGATNKAAGKK